MPDRLARAGLEVEAAGRGERLGLARLGGLGRGPGPGTSSGWVTTTSHWERPERTRRLTGALGSGASNSTAIGSVSVSSPASTTVAAAREASSIPSGPAPTRSAEASRRVPGSPNRSSGRSRTTSGHENGGRFTTASGRPSPERMVAVPGRSPRFGTPVTVPPPSSTSFDGEALVGKVASVISSSAAVAVARVSAGPNVRAKAASTRASAASGRASPTGERYPPKS
ncbi:hypothetical protein GCM10029992_57250 [Glycomyces albus]